MRKLYQISAPIRERHTAPITIKSGNIFPKELTQVPQRTFSIVKPDAVRKGFTGAILAEISKAGFQIVSIKKLSISKPQAEGFYAVHQ